MRKAGENQPDGGELPYKRELKRKYNNLHKVLYSGYADAGRENLPRLLCPLQNARSPKHSASRLWNRTVAPPSTQGACYSPWLPPAAKGAASASPPVYRVEYQGPLTFFQSHSRRGRFLLPAVFHRLCIRLPKRLCINFCIIVSLSCV